MPPAQFYEMSPAEVRIYLDAHKPPEKVGKVDRSTFDRLKGLLQNAKPGNAKHSPDA